MSQLMKQIDQFGQEVYKEIVDDIHTVESWINQHFGSGGAPEGHAVESEKINDELPQTEQHIDSLTPPAVPVAGNDDVGASTEQNVAKPEAPVAEQPATDEAAPAEKPAENAEQAAQPAVEQPVTEGAAAASEVQPQSAGPEGHAA